ncbi:MAG: hypothetical protein HOF86_12845 [Candidatus Marinimicrobia bacterium]|nr:hypothetical protein [Candidatus Neomarinimicrobiota bacterium]
MKLWNVVIVTLSLFILNCDTNNITSSNESEYLARGDDLAQIQPSPPSGTQFGTGNSTWTSSGEEYLKDEYWTKNIYSNLYKVNVFELVSVTYDNPEYIHVNNPVNVTYKHVNLGWISLPRSGYIQTDSIKTGSIGSCTIESDADTKFDDGSGNA